MGQSRSNASKHGTSRSPMLRRFEGDNGNRLLVESFCRQHVVEGSEALADALVKVAELREVAAGETLIEQSASDNDIYFVITGRVTVRVNGRDVAVRPAGTHVGEMALIDPSVRRCATVVAVEDTVVAKVVESDFSHLADQHSRLWRMLALELAERLRQRNELVASPNPRPVLFLGSSTEALSATQMVQSGLAHDDILVKPWTCNVFQPSQYPVDDLLRVVQQADFAALMISPDDRVTSRMGRSDAPRDNVVYELGLAMGQLGRERTVMVMPRGEDIKIPTDLLGLNPITYKVGPEGDLAAAIGPVCNELRQLIRRLGCR